MEELIFVVTPDPDGGFCAAAVGTGIFTQGDTWEELCAMVLDATKAYYFESEAPQWSVSFSVSRSSPSREDSPQRERQRLGKSPDSELALYRTTPTWQPHHPSQRCPRSAHRVDPAHKPLKAGTFRDILSYIAIHKSVLISDLLRDL